MPALLLTPLACHRPQTRFSLLPGLTRAPSGDVLGRSASGEGRWAAAQTARNEHHPPWGSPRAQGGQLGCHSKAQAPAAMAPLPPRLWDEEAGALAPDPGSTDVLDFINSETLWSPGQHSRGSTQRRLETVAWTAVGPHARWGSLTATTAASTGPVVPSRTSRAPPGGGGWWGEQTPGSRHAHFGPLLWRCEEWGLHGTPGRAGTAPGLRVPRAGKGLSPA